MREAIEVQLPNVYRFALRLTKGDVHWAEDLMQETVLRALANPPVTSDGKAIRVWLFRTASNCFHDQVRKNSRRTAVLQSGKIEQPGAAVSAEHQLELKEDVALSLRLLDKLPDRQRSVLYLTACEQMEASEIASILQIRPDAVKASLCVARARMRRAMPELSPEKLSTSSELRSKPN